MATTTYETLEIERDGQRPEVLRVWLNRPERRNAVNDRMMLEVGDLFASLQTDFTTRVVVLGGRGLSFCAGADRKPDDQPLPPPVSERERRWRIHLGRRASRAVEECEIPVIGRIQGHASGGGCVWAVACDFRVATADAVFWYPEVELGVPLSWAATPRLIQEIGTARARQMVMLCERVTGETGERWGLVHEAVPSTGDLDVAVERWVERVLAMPDPALHMTKTQFRGYARAFAQGDVSEADGDQIELARHVPGVRERFAAPIKGA
ncbi:MAG: enoyl-CoA hydratase/isomerase family protein [Acidimicrobiia bacterium]|nr:enoyl-CoA hydratase/isomerase family protein [Acidimicrobiia bacterium]MDH5291739.1 enoyl-CoA hydratase/isomerase family protein [Acidimicrobiia bacterium]